MIQEATKEIEIKIQSILLNEVHIDEDLNCRGELKQIEVIDLIQSIQEIGLKQPVLVRKYNLEQQARTGFKFGLVAGFRRFCAFKCMQRATIPAKIEDELSDSEARMLNLIENVVRKDLNVLQEAKAIEKLHALGIPMIEIGRRINKSQGWVQIRIQVLHFPPSIQKECAEGTINQSQIKAIATLPKEKQIEQVKKIKDQKLRGEKGIQVKRPTSQQSKRARNRAEMNKMLDHVYDTLGPSFSTRILAWCVGNISSADLFRDIKMQCDRENKFYEIPEEEL